ncbi:PAS domain-containing protein [Streptomyces sp. ME19-01-6]|uniref:response regulator n=1 Tax=Streptomyces sp. ME19-01-6 TaxID=3028686 RepID=UPI0029AE53C3|nr:PAS domain-containing protein [Streptomyces sp. ME19-01-6]MDX3227087.1 PAS domain-containing protein [Streptomyces sp. ME19-01-6]
MSSRPSRGAARLAAILDALPDALLLVNCNGTVVNANHIALETFEVPGTALVGRGLLDLLPSFDSNRIPGSMRRRDDQEGGRTRPTRMIARRTDGMQFPVEVTSANLEDGRTPYADQYSYTGDELLMIVVRDLTGTLDTEAELARQQRQTEMILRAAAEGVVGVDTEGKVVLVNPSAAQILGYRASDLGGQELHPLVHHSRPDGSPLPYEESPLTETLRSGRKHRVRGQVLWAKDGSPVPVDLTTAPVRDGEQLVGAVMTFTDRRPEETLVSKHAEEVKSLTAKHAKELEKLTARHTEEREKLSGQLAKERKELTAQLAREREAHVERYDALAARNAQLLAVLEQSLRGPLLELRGELGVLADDPAGQLWPEANQILHHLAAGYTRMTTLVDNVLSYQRLDSGGEEFTRHAVSMDEVVAAGVEGAVELIGPGRAQFAVHAPPIEAEVDAERLAQALAHLIADVAGVDSTGKAAAGPGGATGDSTIVVAAAQRGDVVRIEVRGPYAGGDPVHEPIVRGIVRRHGGVLQTHEMPGMGGHAYVLEVPISAAAADQAGEAESAAAASGRTSGRGTGAGNTGAGSAAGQAGTNGTGTGQTPTGPTGRRARRGPAGGAGNGTNGAGTNGADTSGAGTSGAGTSGASPHGSGTNGGTDGRPPARGADPRTPSTQGAGHRGARAGSAPPASAAPAPDGDDTAAGQSAEGEQPRPTGRRRARRHPDEEQQPTAASANADTDGQGSGAHRHAHGAAPQAGPQANPQAGPQAGPQPPAMGPVPPQGVAGQPSPPAGRRARRGAPAEAGQGRSALALPPAAADAAPPTGGWPAAPGPDAPPAAQGGSAMPALPAARTPEQQQNDWNQPQSGANAGPGPLPPALPAAQPAGRRRARRALAEAPGRAEADEAQPQPQPQSQPASDPVGGRSPFALPPAAADRDPQSALPPELGPVGLVPAQHGARDPRGGAAPGAQGGHGAQGAHGTQAAQGGAPVPSRGGGLAVRGGPVPPNAGLRSGGWPAAPGPDAPPAAQGGSAMPALPAARTPEQQQNDWNQPQSGQAAPDGPYDADEGPYDAYNADDTDDAPQPTGRRRARRPLADEEPGPGGMPALEEGAPQPGPWPGGPVQPQPQPQRRPQQLPAAEPAPGPEASQGRAISVRTLGQGVPFAQQASEHHPQHPQAQPQTPSGGTATAGAGRRRKLAARPDPANQAASAELEPAGRAQPPHPGGQPHPGAPGAPGAQPRPQPGPGSGPGPHRPASPQSAGRAFAIGAPDEGAEGPEPLDGPNGAIEVVDDHTPPPDDELPPEPLDNPRRLLVWPAPDMSTQQALSDRGYRPVIVHSREEVDAQIAAYPAALFVDPLTGPITRTALQSLRTAAVAAEVPVLVTSGLGQASREAAYGADPAVLFKALAPRDSEQHPPRVLLIEEHQPISEALTATLERRGMQVARAATDADAVTLAAQMRPNLVVMDLMQVRRRRAGIVDWLRGNGLLNRTPLVVYTSADIDPANLSRLSSGETVLFLAERSTSAEVQGRIVDLLAKIGNN